MDCFSAVIILSINWCSQLYTVALVAICILSSVLCLIF